MSNRDLHLDLPGGIIALRFGPGHEELAAEAKTLWAHLAVAAPAAGMELSPERDSSFGRDPAEPFMLNVLVPEEVPGEEKESAAVVRIAPGPGAAYTLSGRITRRILRALIGRRILLHAGVVDHRDHGTMILVGPSGAGKSRATTVLAREGNYLTDELAIIDPESLELEAYPKPVSRVIKGSTSKLKRDLALPGQGLNPAKSAGAIRYILLLNRVSGPSATGAMSSGDESRNPDSSPIAPTLRRVPLAEALAAIIEQSSSMWRVPEALGVLASLLTTVGGALEVTYTDAEQIAPLLAEPPTPVREEWEVLPVPAWGRAAAHNLPARTEPAEGEGSCETDPVPVQVPRFRCAPHVSALLTDDALVVLSERKVRVLRGIGGLIWELLHEAHKLTASQIEAELVAVMGDDPNSAQRVTSTLRELRDIGAILEER